MLFTQTSGIDTHVIHGKDYNQQSTFQLVGTEASLAAMADIVFEIPDTDFEPSQFDANSTNPYTGGWSSLIQGGNAVILNNNDRATTIYGSLIFRVSKTVDQAVGVHWAW